MGAIVATLAGRMPAAPDQAFTARRIALLGYMGAGKTTFAARLADHLGIPHVEPDGMLAAAWRAGRTGPEGDAEIIASLPADGHWVLDGVFQQLAGTIFERADCVIHLRTPFVRSYCRVLARVWRQLTGRERRFSSGRRLRPPLYSSYSEPLWALIIFWRDSRLRRRIPDDTEVLVFRSEREATRWLEGLPPASSPPGAAAAR